MALKYIRPEIEVHNDLQPTQDVALGFRFAKVKDLSELNKEELKQRCLDLADELREFLEAYGLNEVDRAEMNIADFVLDIARADIETMRQYRRRCKARVTAMFAELKRRGWWAPESLDSEERKRLQNPDSPFDVQEIAEHLDTIGHRL